MPTRTLIDEDWAKVDPQAARSLGYTGVIGYVSQDVTGKNLTAAQVSQIHAAGLDVGLVYEYNPKSALGAYGQGVADGAIAVAHAQTLNAPRGMCLYAAVDWRVAQAEMSAVHGYMMGYSDQVHGHGFTAGAYADYAVCVYLQQSGWLGRLWQTYAWSNGLWADNLSVRQVRNGVHVAGATVDQDTTDVIDWGQWSADGSLPPGNGGTDMAAFTDLQVQQIQDTWDWVAGEMDPDPNAPVRSRFAWPALKIAQRFSAIDAAIAALTAKVDAITPLPADVVDDLHTIAADLRKLAG